jgi:hypothetical protein
MPAPRTIYVTRTALPLSFHFDWPFHQSTSGADFSVLHADIRLENSDGLHAPVSVNLSATVREVMPSLDPKDAEAPVINSLRKEVDRRQIEFLKSGKLVPVNFSSRHWDFTRNKWVFGKATDQQIEELIARKVFWHAKLTGENAWLADPTEALYVETAIDHFMQLAQNLQSQGMIDLHGEYAAPKPQLVARADQFIADMRAALEELEKKHSFERG